MIVTCRKLFDRGNDFVNWFYEPGKIAAKKAGDVIGSLSIVGLIVLVIFRNWITFKIVGGLMANMFVALILIGLLKDSRELFPRFTKRFFSKHANALALFRDFTHKSYLFGIFIFAFYAAIFEYLIVMEFAYIVGISVKFSSLYYNLAFLTASSFTVLFFMYHLVHNTVSVKRIKARLALYAAIATTISTVVIWPFLQEAFKPMITYLGIGFTWLIYCSEQVEVEFEEECKKSIA